ncbi:geraniol 8-hydroxylase-like [Corylus avellana]|uniref:geraniol 8-hydroxylase-like n=1 Tax=Corylus avellana TaxID=13451 RepID=UPI00286AC9A9|nr:geraniol 8-hydroxylase-like [Corylus avellana]
MDFLSFVIGLCLIWILIKTFSYGRSKPVHRKLPLGPKPLPVIGNLLELGDKPHNSLTKLAKAHGDIMILKLGRVTTIVISSADMAKQVLQTHDRLLANRTIPDAIRVYNSEEFSLPWIPVSSRWRNLRKICNGQLFSNTALDANQDIRRKKVQELFAETRQSSQTGEAVEIGRAAFKTTLNLLSNTILSVDLADPNSDAARKFQEIVWNILKEAGKPNIVDHFPLFQKLDPQGIRRRMTVNFRKMIGLFSGMINERLQLRKVSDFITNRDMLDTLLNITEENNEMMDMTTMEHFVLDLFVAGTDTTSVTLEWAMAELLHNPEALSKAKIELDQVIGKGNPVEESDITRLPYLQAIVKETFRLHPAVPLLLPRKAEADVEINGYIIPKGAQVLVNAWAIGRDPTIWENANLFMPERFLGSEIDVRGRNFELIPFGGGRRICPGLPLVIRVLHSMLGSLIHTFNWRLEDGVKREDMNMEEKFGITLQRAHPLRAVPILASLK